MTINFGIKRNGRKGQKVEKYLFRYIQIAKNEELPEEDSCINQ